MDNSGNVLCFDPSYVRTVIFSVEGYTLVNTKQANLCSYALSKSSVRSLMCLVICLRVWTYVMTTDVVLVFSRR